MRFFAIICLLFCGSVSFAQKSYLIANHTEKDTAFLMEKCRQAGLDLALIVQANRVPTDSKWVSPKPSVHLLKQGTLQLQLPLNERQEEFAVYHSELFDTPTSINVLQIDDELITYRTTEATGDIHLLYHCKRGAFGTKATSHSKNATVYKLWDTPERTLLPDLALQDQMIQTEARRCANTCYPVLVFNDLKSYAYNEQGDEAIRHFLDTMHKYNPEKKLQADLLTPASRHYLSQVNENQRWTESMRTKIIETLNERQNYYPNNQMPWMIGDFQILLSDKNRKATTMEELEWFLSKAAAYDAGFGLECSIETLKKHGLMDEMLNTIMFWETLRLSGAFSELQKELFKDPYGNWHLEKRNDSTYWLYAQQTSRQYVCELTQNEMQGQWNWKSHCNTPLSFIVKVEGKGSISDLCLTSQYGKLTFPFTIQPGQYLVFDGSARITDSNYNTIETIELQSETTSVFKLLEGDNLVHFTCTFTSKEKRIPEVSVRYITREEHETIRL